MINDALNHQIWTLLMFEAFLRNVVDESPASSHAVAEAALALS
jgi:hypothetical protein